MLVSVFVIVYFDLEKELEILVDVSLVGLVVIFL